MAKSLELQIIFSAFLYNKFAKKIITFPLKKVFLNFSFESVNADIIYDILDKENDQKQIKGWVQILK